MTDQIPTNPYGGHTAVPPPGAGSSAPGTIGYVEARFGPVAGFGDRALALLIDVAVSVVALVPMALGFALLVAAVPDTYATDEYGNLATGGGSGGLAVAGGLVIGLSALLALGIQLWNRVFRMGRRGQSIGKSQMGLMLVDTRTGQPIGAGRCFARELLSGLVNQAFYISYLWMLWDANRQTIADLAMTSTVIKVPRR